MRNLSESIVDFTKRNYVENILMKHLLLFFLLVASVVTADAQEITSCKVIGPKQGFFLVEIDGKTYRAMSADMFNKLKARSEQDNDTIKKLKALREEYRTKLGDYQQLSAKYETLRQDHVALTDQYSRSLSDSVALNEKYKESSEKLLELTTRYDKLARDFDELAGKYRDVAVDKTSFITIDLGAGVTDKSGEAEGAALLGIGISKLKVWGFFQNDNSGILAGASFKF